MLFSLQFQNSYLLWSCWNKYLYKINSSIRQDLISSFSQCWHSYIYKYRSLNWVPTTVTTILVGTLCTRIIIIYCIPVILSTYEVRSLVDRDNGSVLLLTTLYIDVTNRTYSTSPLPPSPTFILQIQYQPSTLLYVILLKG